MVYEERYQNKKIYPLNGKKKEKKEVTNYLYQKGLEGEL
jgi:hypothetical protein